jgi:hypothetical protein
MEIKNLKFYSGRCRRLQKNAKGCKRKNMLKNLKKEKL